MAAAPRNSHAASSLLCAMCPSRFSATAPQGPGMPLVPALRRKPSHAYRARHEPEQDMNDLFTPGSNESAYSAKDIEVLEGLEPVRRRPGMYIGGTDENALHHLAAEILDNAMDEAVAGFANRIEVELDVDDVIRIHDNGRGIPIDPHPKFK